jgi:hypothetical protein
MDDPPPVIPVVAAAGGDDVVGAVTAGFRLPDFWVEDPTVWFLQVDAKFRRARITSSRVKYEYVLPLLPPKVMTQCRDVLIAASNDEEADPFARLRERLVGSYTPSKWQLAYRIIHHPDIGDRRPSQLMASMLALLPVGEQPNVLFQALFLERLPEDMRKTLGSMKFESCREMAAHGDLVWDAAMEHGQVVAAVQRSSSPAGRSGSPVRSGRRERRSGTPGPGKKDGLCRYHHRWGAAAHQCVPPCSWSGNAPAAGGN